jgi:CheY-like chemotaxis protein
MSEKQKTILSIDNDEDVRTTIVDIVEALGYRCLEASSARTAFEVLDKEIVDLILLDIKMPNVHGHQFLGVMRQRGYVTPVMVISGYLQKDVIKQVTGLGVVSVLAKPIRIKRFSEELLKALEPEGDA